MVLMVVEDQSPGTARNCTQPPGSMTMGANHLSCERTNLQDTYSQPFHLKDYSSLASAEASPPLIILQVVDGLDILLSPKSLNRHETRLFDGARESRVLGECLKLE